MKRSLFLQILVRVAVACALLCAALWLAQNLWVGVIAGLVVSFLLASSVVRLCREDETALEGAVLALGEGREIQLQPAFVEHERLAATIRSANDELQRNFAVSAERRYFLVGCLTVRFSDVRTTCTRCHVIK